jgi:hypothetical protein
VVQLRAIAHELRSALVARTYIDATLSDKKPNKYYLIISKI